MKSINKIPRIDLDVVRRDLERCPNCGELPHWTAHAKSCGYELACQCRRTTHLRSANLAASSWKKTFGYPK